MYFHHPDRDELDLPMVLHALSRPAAAADRRASSPSADEAVPAAPSAST